MNTQTSDQADLAFLNGGLSSQDALAFAADGGKAYQPSVLPFTSGGHRWVVFTSTRAYGNQLNAVGTHFSCAAPLLWMAALDDAPAGTTDSESPRLLAAGPKSAFVPARQSELSLRSSLPERARLGRAERLQDRECSLHGRLRVLRRLAVSAQHHDRSTVAQL
ncbi:MAG: hypothetical protein QM756_28725 [Polyangiaceae bacterium]